MPRTQSDYEQSFTFKMFAFQVGILAFITIMSQHLIISNYLFLVNFASIGYNTSRDYKKIGKKTILWNLKKLTNIPFQFINFYASLIYIAFFKVICVCLNIVNKVLVEHVCWTWLFLKELYKKAYMQKTCDVAKMAILAKKNLQKKCANRDKM